MLEPSAQSKPESQETPVEAVLRVFGAARASAICELTTDALRKWKRSIRAGGGGGLVPARYQARFLREARRTGRALEPEQLIAEPVE